MLEVEFTKPNEQSHLSIGFGKCGDGSSFVCIDGNRDGYSVNPPERVTTEEKEQSERLITFFFYQDGSIKALIEAAQRALELLSYPADRIVDANKKVEEDDVSQWPDWKKRAALGNYELGKEDGE